MITGKIGIFSRKPRFKSEINRNARKECIVVKPASISNKLTV